MNFIETLHLETLENNSDSIMSLMSGVATRYANTPSLTMESSGFSKMVKVIRDRISFKKHGNYDANYVVPYEVTENWLVVKEKVIDSPVTYSHATISTIIGHILKSRVVLGSSETLLDSFIKQVAMLISDPSQLSTMSGIVPVVTEKNSAVHGIPTLSRVIDLSRASRVKLETLFNSVSDMNVAVSMSNDLNNLLSDIDMVNISSKIERLADLVEVLEKSVGDKGTRKNVESIINQTGLLAALFSDLSHIVTVAESIANTLTSVHDVIE